MENLETQTPQQQQQTERLLRGTVTDKDGQPLPGVAVQVKGTTQGVATNVDGEYYIMVKGVENPVLVFSFIGMETKEVPYQRGKHTINVTLRESQQLLDEVVVTLRSIDPAFNIVENNSFGSDPNRLPEITSQEFRWLASVGYKDIQGAMIGSERKTFNGAVTLSYTYKDLIFRNQTSIF